MEYKPQFGNARCCRLVKPCRSCDAAAIFDGKASQLAVDMGLLVHQDGNRHSPRINDIKLPPPRLDTFSPLLAANFVLNVALESWILNFLVRLTHRAIYYHLGTAFTPVPPINMSSCMCQPIYLSEQGSNILSIILLERGERKSFSAPKKS